MYTGNLRAAIQADKADVAEELTRLSSHFEQFGIALAQTGPVGRRLDFLTQEMNREINTIGSKAVDAEVELPIRTLWLSRQVARETASAQKR